MIYSVFRGEKGRKEDKDYDYLTTFAIKEAIKWRESVLGEQCIANIYVDALKDGNKRHKYMKLLRSYGIDVPPRGVHGVAKDENNSLIRLADSVAGFVRDVVFDGDEGELKALFTRVSRSGALVEVLR